MVVGGGINGDHKKSLDMEGHMHAASQGVEKGRNKKGNDQKRRGRRRHHNYFERAHKYLYKYQFRALDEYEALIWDIFCACILYGHSRQRGRRRVVAPLRKVVF